MAELPAHPQLSALFAGTLQPVFQLAEPDLSQLAAELQSCEAEVIDAAAALLITQKSLPDALFAVMRDRVPPQELLLAAQARPAAVVRFAPVLLPRVQPVRRRAKLLPALLRSAHRALQDEADREKDDSDAEDEQEEEQAGQTPQKTVGSDDDSNTPPPAAQQAAEAKPLAVALGWPVALLQLARHFAALRDGVLEEDDAEPVEDALLAIGRAAVRTAAQPAVTREIAQQLRAKKKPAADDSAAAALVRTLEACSVDFRHNLLRRWPLPSHLKCEVDALAVEEQEEDDDEDGGRVWNRLGAAVIVAASLLLQGLDYAPVVWR